jgi:hypothetical protein
MGLFSGSILGADPRVNLVSAKAFAEFEVCVIDGNGCVLHRYTYRTIESARRAAAAWTAAYDNCPIEDTTLVTKGPWL